MGENELLEKIKLNVVQGRIENDDQGLEDDMTGEPAVKELVQQAIEAKVDAARLLEYLRGAMDVVGEKYEGGEYFIPDMLASAEAVGDKSTPGIVKHIVVTGNKGLVCENHFCKKQHRENKKNSNAG